MGELTVVAEKTFRHLHALLAETYRMTPAEVRVCQAIAVEGLSPKECAGKFGVSISTVRTQLQSIFRKTESTRQVDLVRLIAKLNVRSRKSTGTSGSSSDSFA